mmetsp:Transcript_42516/g.51030  ORF Transcript_42516/g.51030 Transcript_42516/m.51030 type:complete len:411 (-) Transcript_42516:380-1612(-)
MKFSLAAIATLAVLPSQAIAETFLKEQFNDGKWSDRWTVASNWKSASEMGKWEPTVGKWHGSDESDMGLQTTEDARFYGLSAKLDKPLINSGKTTVIQYTVKHEQKLDCGGAYIKLLPGGDKLDALSFGGDTPYAIMFGPDMCGSTKRTHVILNSEKKDENVMIKKDIMCETDQLSHLYTLVLSPDNTFEVFVDNKSVRTGSLEKEFPFLPDKEIKDPDVSKPEDWVDQREIEDPESAKPAGYDEIPADIPDPDAVKPDDWDSEEDGEWEPPMVDNPEYEGPWSPKMIPNPDYKGAWKHPMIDNPEYADDDKLYEVCGGSGCTHIGFELWQVKSGTIFDDIIITDSLEEAQKFAEETFFAKKDGEKEMWDAAEAERKAAEPEPDFGGDDDDDEEMDDDDDGEEFDMGDEF